MQDQWYNQGNAIKGPGGALTPRGVVARRWRSHDVSDSTLSPRTFSFLDPLPIQDLDREFRFTPLWPDAPLAPADAHYCDTEDDFGQIVKAWHWRVLRCPYCGGTHWHRGFDSTFRDRDPRAFLGGRKAHCKRADQNWWLNVEYRLVGVRWAAFDGTRFEPADEVADLDRHFPVVPESFEARLPHGNARIYVTRVERGVVRITDKERPFTTTRQPIPRELRAAVWQKTFGRCYLCGAMTNPFANLHIDHLHPVADGGTNEIENLWAACADCNQAKHAMSLEAFRQRRGGGLFWFEVARMGGAS